MLVLLGLALAAQVGHQLLWVNRASAHAGEQVAQRLERQWAQPLPAERDPSPRPGQGLALLRIPALADEWSRQPVVEGVGEAQLATGVGHYPGTALPGEVGNFAVAGHRDGHGEPFAQLDRLAPGDTVEVLTRSALHVYRVTGSEVVAPSETSVLAPVPGERRMTLTTCHPRFSSRQRLVYHATLEASRPRTG